MKRLRIFVLSVLVLVAIAGCKNPFSPTKYHVEYRVTETARSVSVTYQNADGGISQAFGVPLPWSYSFTAEPGTWVYVSAQNDGETGWIRVTIYKDGEEFKTSTSSGPYCIATAHGTL